MMPTGAVACTQQVWGVVCSLQSTVAAHQSSTWVDLNLLTEMPLGTQALGSLDWVHPPQEESLQRSTGNTFRACFLTRPCLGLETTDPSTSHPLTNSEWEGCQICLVAGTAYQKLRVPVKLRVVACALPISPRVICMAHHTPWSM